MWTPSFYPSNIGLWAQFHIKPQTLTICFFVCSFIQQIFFSLCYVLGMVSGAQETDHPALGSPWSRRGPYLTGSHGGVSRSSERGGGYWER